MSTSSRDPVRADLGATRCRFGFGLSMGSLNVERQDTKHQLKRDRDFVSQCYDSAQGRVTLHIKLSSRIGSLPLLLQPSDPYLKKHLDTSRPPYDR